MKLKAIPCDALMIMDTLPQDALDDIQMQLVLFSTLEAAKMGPKQPSKRELARLLNRTAEKHVQLLRIAKAKAKGFTDER
jgi:hypothetical protein